MPQALTSNLRTVTCGFFHFYLPKNQAIWRWNGRGDYQMTHEQKSQIVALRAQGLGYKKVAQMLSLSVNTVKSYCKRSQASEPGTQSSNVTINNGYCRQCGKPLTQPKGKKRISFCSDTCRQQWWKTHPEKVHRRPTAMYSYICPACGNPFSAYGNSHRKYCCHACYVADRYGGGAV